MAEGQRGAGVPRRLTVYIEAPSRPDRLDIRRRKISRRLRWWIIASVLVHALLLAALFYFAPDAPPGPPGDAGEIAMVFGREAGADQDATKAPLPNPAAPVAQGNPNAPPAPQAPDTSVLPPPPLASNEPATPPPESKPVEPAPAPTVILHPEGELPRPPPFIMPLAPRPLAPLPPTRPTLPRIARAPTVRPSPLAHPQDWSLEGAPSLTTPGRASRGINLGIPNGGSREDSDMAYVRGAQPSGDWGAELKKWAQARVYYPQQAASNGEQGTSIVEVTIDRSGIVQSTRLVDSARSPFLDGAWLDVWRGSKVPAFTSDMTEQTTTIRFALHYHLIRR